MDSIFLSASVPQPGRGTYHETANPYLIQTAVRELVIAAVRERRIVWGGHPAITPMVAAICSDLGSESFHSVVLYQSRYFQKAMPQENRLFPDSVLVEGVPGDRELSVLRMREEMLSRQDLVAAVFIGGMEGVEAEYELFRKHHPKGVVLPVAAPGGAARRLAERLGCSEVELNQVDFVQLYHSRLGLTTGAIRKPGGLDGA